MQKEGSWTKTYMTTSAFVTPPSMCLTGIWYQKHTKAVGTKFLGAELMWGPHPILLQLLENIHQCKLELGLAKLYPHFMQYTWQRWCLKSIHNGLYSCRDSFCYLPIKEVWLPIVWVLLAQNAPTGTVCAEPNQVRVVLWTLKPREDRQSLFLCTWSHLLTIYFQLEPHIGRILVISTRDTTETDFSSKDKKLSYTIVS